LTVSSDLEHIRVRFATFRERTLAERSADARRLGTMPARERVLLDTCHRVELVSVDDGPLEGPLLAGREAVRRVFQVVAGFDSAVVAEEQLLGQVRMAYEAALDQGSTGAILNELFRRALRFGRRVRTHATPGTDRSLADRGAAWVGERLSDTPSRVLVAGTGQMGRQAATRLAGMGHQVTVLSSSSERGGRMLAALGAPHGLIVGALEHATVASSAAIVLAVRSREPILTEEHVAQGNAPWVLDLSTPAAVSSDAAGLLGARLLGLDRLAEVAGSAPVLEPEIERRLRAEMDVEVDRFVAWLDTRRSADALAILHGEAEAVRSRHLERLRRQGALEPAQLAAVEAASAAIVGELLHGPSMELRRGGADADTVRRLFRLDA
jgi:glutamyl-tRNA reductase